MRTDDDLSPVPVVIGVGLGCATLAAVLLEWPLAMQFLLAALLTVVPVAVDRITAPRRRR